ncbi:MAG: hypothetical protein WBK28_00710 [Minisyncoccia bacterium]
MAQIYQFPSDGIRPQAPSLEDSDEGRGTWRDRRNGCLLTLLLAVIFWGAIISFGIWLWALLT